MGVGDGGSDRVALPVILVTPRFGGGEILNRLRTHRIVERAVGVAGVDPMTLQGTRQHLVRPRTFPNQPVGRVFWITGLIIVLNLVGIRPGGIRRVGDIGMLARQFSHPGRAHCRGCPRRSRRG